MQLIIFLLPLIGAYNGLGFEQIKVLFFIVSISLIGFFFIKSRIKWTPISKVAGGFILVLCLTSTVGIDPKISFLGSQPYFQGVILYSFLFLFFLIVKNSKAEFEDWALVLTLSAGLVGVLAIKDWVFLNIFHQAVPTYAGRVVSSFGQPNFFAGYLLLVLPFCCLLFKNRNQKLQLLGWVSGLICFVGIIVSYSRSSIILALILLILGLIDQLKIKEFILVLVVFLSLAVFLSINFSSGFVWREFFYPTTILNPDLTKESVEKRAYIWPQAFKVGLERPIFGYGLENINLAFFKYFDKYKHVLFEENLNISPVLISLKELNLDRTHSYILDLFLFSGILGIFVWLGLIIIVFKKLMQKKGSQQKNILLVSLISYLIWIQFQNQSVVHLVYFWFLIGTIDKE